MVDDSLRDFDPRLGEIFRTCLDRGHVDAEPRPGKVGGAYCNSVSKNVLPYILMNYTDQLRDVVTLAHEFGHAVHGTLSLERQTYRSYHTGLALAEVPSTFAQLLAVERLIEPGGGSRDARDASRRPRRGRDGVDLPPDDDGAVRGAGVCRSRRGEGADQRPARRDLDRGERALLRRLDRAARRAIGSAGRTSRTSSTFASTPTPTRSRISSRSRSPRATARIPSASRRRISTSSASGSSRSPQDLLAPLGVDLRDPQTWAHAFAEFDRCVAEAEAGVDELGSA